MKNILMRSILLSLVVVFFTAGICSAQNFLYFPQFADGRNDANSVAWGTVIGVQNPAAIGTAATTVSVTVIADNGTPLNLGFTDQTGAPVGSSFQLAGGQSKYVFSPSNFHPQTPLSNGFVTVTSNLPVTASLIFIEYAAGGGNPISEGGVLSASPLTRQAIGVVRVPAAPGQLGIEPAIALANPGTGTATVTSQVLDFGGTAVGSAVTRTLDANNHTALFVSQLVTSIPTPFFGTVRITSDTPIVAVALLFWSNGTFATIPVSPLQ